MGEPKRRPQKKDRGLRSRWTTAGRGGDAAEGARVGSGADPTLRGHCQSPAGGGVFGGRGPRSRSGPKRRNGERRIGPSPTRRGGAEVRLRPQTQWTSRGSRSGFRPSSSSPIFLGKLKVRHRRGGGGGGDVPVFPLDGDADRSRVWRSGRWVQRTTSVFVLGDHGGRRVGVGSVGPSQSCARWSEESPSKGDLPCLHRIRRGRSGPDWCCDWGPEPQGKKEGGRHSPVRRRGSP